MRRLPLLAVLALASRPALAHEAIDWFDPVPSGGLQVVGQGPLRLVGERLEIQQLPLEGNPLHAAAFTVEYRIANDASVDQVGVVVFTEPDRTWNLQTGAPAIEALALSADGIPVPVERRVRAVKAGEDVTEQLTALGVDPERFPGTSADESAFLKRLGPKTVEALEQAHLLDGIRPEWAARVTHRWSQHFPRRAEVVLRARYRALPGCCQQQPRWLEAPACLDPGTLPDVQQHGVPLHVLGAVWPAFVLESPVPEARTLPLELLVTSLTGWRSSFCWSGPVEQLSPTRVRARARALEASGALRIYFVEWPR
jgi:hypothetical protein